MLRDPRLKTGNEGSAECALNKIACTRRLFSLIQHKCGSQSETGLGLGLILASTFDTDCSSVSKGESRAERERTFRLINILHLARQWPFKGASPRESKLCCGWCSRRPGLNSFSDRPRMAATILTWVSSWLPEHQLGYLKAGELVSYLGPYPCLYWWVSSRRHFL